MASKNLFFSILVLLLVTLAGTQMGDSFYGSKPVRAPQSDNGSEHFKLKPFVFKDQVYQADDDDDIKTAEEGFKLCSLPRQFIKPEIYERYCGNGICLAYGNSCSLSKSCCSGMCIDKKCASSEKLKGFPGQRCQLHSDCYSNSCQTAGNSNYKVCIGNSDPSSCSNLREYCKEDSNCCSGVCHGNRCLGSAADPAGIGQYCFADHSECASRNCDLETHRCE